MTPYIAFFGLKERKILVCSKKYTSFLTFSCQKITEDRHMFVFCNFLTKKKVRKVVDFCGRQVSNLLSLILCLFLPFDYRVSCNSPIAYQYSPIKVTSLEKEVFDFKSFNAFLNLR